MFAGSATLNRQREQTGRISIPPGAGRPPDGPHRGVAHLCKDDAPAEEQGDDGTDQQNAQAHAGDAEQATVWSVLSRPAGHPGAVRGDAHGLGVTGAVLPGCGHHGHRLAGVALVRGAVGSETVHREEPQQRGDAEHSPEWDGVPDGCTCAGHQVRV
jgi:hypothetical protein